MEQQQEFLSTRVSKVSFNKNVLFFFNLTHTLLKPEENMSHITDGTIQNEPPLVVSTLQHRSDSPILRTSLTVLLPQVFGFSSNFKVGIV